MQDDLDKRPKTDISQIFSRKFRVNTNGHAIATMMDAWLIGVESLLKLHDFISNGQTVPLAEPFQLGKSPASERTCSYCGEVPELETDGVTVTAKSSCPMPDGIKLEFELAVPSGVMVVCDDLRVAYEADPDGKLDINLAFYDAEYSRQMAALGCAFGRVGNTCPSVYRVSDDSYTIAGSGVTYLDGSKCWDDPIEPEGEELFQIVTDLWAYSIADEADFLAKCTDPRWHSIPDRLTVRPGVYRFRHHTFEAEFDRDGKPGEPVIYAHFEWVRPIDS